MTFKPTHLLKVNDRSEPVMLLFGNLYTFSEWRRMEVPVYSIHEGMIYFLGTPIVEASIDELN